MLEGMYAAAAGVQAQQARLDSLSNDIANVNTPGYKPLRTGFRDLLYSEGGLATRGGTQLGAGAAITDLGRRTGQGSTQQTGEVLDVVIAGTGFIQVKNAAGEPLLTRDGHLQVDTKGRLSTSTGQLLDPPITLPPNADPSKIEIAATGAVTLEGKPVGKITLVDVTVPSELRAVGDNSFAPTATSGAVNAAPAATRLISGAIEMSSADLGETMTAMIETQRAFELASKAITTQDKIAEIANSVKR